MCLQQVEGFTGEDRLHGRRLLAHDQSWIYSPAVSKCKQANVLKHALFKAFCYHHNTDHFY